ncbi:MAG: DUF4870 domain-containing protein [Bacteroidia bacterium]
METNTETPTSGNEDKTVAIVAYITLIGYIVAIIMHGNKKTALGTYHLRQATGLIITAFASWIAMFIIGMIPFVNFILILLAPVIWIGILVLLIMGVIAASNGEMKPLPLVGKMFEKMLGNAFN